MFDGDSYIVRQNGSNFGGPTASGEPVRDLWVPAGEGLINLMSMKPPLIIFDDLQRYSDGEVYDAEYTKKDYNIMCVSPQDRYHWGFSAWVLILATAFHGAWCILLSFLYIYSIRRSQMCQRGRHLRGLKAIMHMSQVVASQVHGHATMRAVDIDCAMRGKQLRYRVVQEANGSGCTFVEAVGRDGSEWRCRDQVLRSMRQVHQG